MFGLELQRKNFGERKNRNATASTTMPA